MFWMAKSIIGFTGRMAWVKSPTPFVIFDALATFAWPLYQLLHDPLSLARRSRVARLGVRRAGLKVGLAMPRLVGEHRRQAGWGGGMLLCRVAGTSFRTMFRVSLLGGLGLCRLREGRVR